MHFRSAKQDDLSVIISWIPDAAACKRWAGPAVNFPLTPASLSREITFSANNSYCLVEKGNLVGFGQLIRKSKQRLHAARIIVDPPARGRGFGRTLCQSLIKRAAELKYPRISLNVYKDIPTAILLYQSLGFREKKKSKEDGMSKDICYMETGTF
jgi:ribosomal-protein-alanine N-acetyltransferase